MLEAALRGVACVAIASIAACASPADSREAEELARTIQLIIEYDPHPPFDTGSVDKAPAAIVEHAREMIREIYG